MKRRAQRSQDTVNNYWHKPWLCACKNTLGYIDAKIGARDPLFLSPPPVRPPVSETEPPTSLPIFWKFSHVFRASCTSNFPLISHRQGYPNKTTPISHQFTESETNRSSHLHYYSRLVTPAIFTHRTPTTMYGVSMEPLWPPDHNLIGGFGVPASWGLGGTKEFWREIQFFLLLSLYGCHNIYANMTSCYVMLTWCHVK